MQMINHFYEGIETMYTKRINDSKINSEEFNRVVSNLKHLKQELLQLNNDLSHSQGAQVK